MLGLAFLILLPVYATYGCINSSPRAEIICYYNGDLDPSLVDPCKCTILVVSKVQVGNYLKIQSNLDFKAITNLKKKNSDLKILISIGGDSVKPHVFTEAASTAEGTANFTSGIKEFIDFNLLDGLEINWRWPGAPGGLKTKDDLTSFIKTLRNTLDENSSKISKRSVQEISSSSAADTASLPEEGSGNLSPEDVQKNLPAKNISTNETTLSKNKEDLRYDTDYLLLDDYEFDSAGKQNPNIRRKDKTNTTLINEKDEERTDNKDETTKSKRGRIKFRDHFPTDNNAILLRAATRQSGKLRNPEGIQGGLSKRRGWRVASKKVLGPVDKIRRPLQERIGDGKILVLTLPSKPEYIVKGYDLKSLARIVDMFNVPSDNLTTGSVNLDRGSVTYHHSRLMGLSDIHNADSLLDLLVSMGVPLDRLILGIPTYASMFDLVNPEENLPSSPTLHPPSWISYSSVCNYLDNGNWTIERDDDLTAPFAYKNHTWIAFDDAVSLRIKSKYTLLRGLAGIGVHTLDDDDSQGSCSQGPYPLLTSIFEIFTQLARTPRKAVLSSLVRDLETSESIVRASYIGSSTDLRISPFRIVRVVDKTGEIRAIRSSDDDDSKYECSRQGYYRDPDDCSLFYRCVKFNQLIDDYTVFEYSCPPGLVFDDRWEICAWPSTASPCDGSSEIFPVPRRKNICAGEGYFTDPENCRWFFACRDYYGTGNFTLYEFRCPFGLGYDEENKICNWPWLVPMCKEYDPVPNTNDRRGRGKAIIASSSFQSQVNDKPEYKECIDCDVEITVGGDGIFHPEKGIIISSSYLENAEKLRSLSLKHRQKSSNILSSENISGNVGLGTANLNSKADTNRFILKSGNKNNFRGNTFSKNGKSFTPNRNNDVTRLKSQTGQRRAQYDVVPLSDEHGKNINSHLPKNQEENVSHFIPFKPNIKEETFQNIKSNVEDDIRRSNNLLGKPIKQNNSGNKGVFEYTHSIRNNDKVKVSEPQRSNEKEISSYFDVGNIDKNNFNSFSQGTSDEIKFKKYGSNSKTLAKSSSSYPSGVSENTYHNSENSQEEREESNAHSGFFGNKFEVNNQQQRRTNFFNSKSHEVDEKIKDDTDYRFSTPTLGINQHNSVQDTPGSPHSKIFQVNENYNSHNSGASTETEGTKERKIPFKSKSDSLKSHFTISRHKLQNSNERIHLGSQKGYTFNEPNVKFDSFGVVNNEDFSDESTLDSSHFKILDNSDKRRPQNSQTNFNSRDSSHTVPNSERRYKYDEPTVRFEPFKNRKPSTNGHSKFDEKIHSESQKGLKYNEPVVKFNPFDSEDKNDEDEDIGLSHFKISDSSERRRTQSSEGFRDIKQKNKNSYNSEEPIISFNTHKNRNPSSNDKSKSSAKIQSANQKGYRYDEPKIKFNPLDTGEKDDDVDIIGLSHFKISDSGEKKRPQTKLTNNRQNNANKNKYENPTVNFDGYNNRKPFRDNGPESDEKINLESRKGHRFAEPKAKFDAFDYKEENNRGISHFKVTNSGEKRRSQTSRTTFTSKTIINNDQNDPKISFDSNRNGDIKSAENIPSESHKGYRYDEPTVKFNPFDNDDSADEDKVTEGLSHFRISNSDKKRRPQSSRKTFESRDFSSTEQSESRGYKYEEPKESFDPFNRRELLRDNTNPRSDEKFHPESQKALRDDEPKVKFNPFGNNKNNNDKENKGSSALGLSHFTISDSGERRKPQSSRSSLLSEASSQTGSNSAKGYKYEEPTVNFDPYNNRKPSRGDDDKSEEKTYSESQKGYRYDEPEVKFNPFDNNHKDEEDKVIGLSHFKISDSSEKRKPESSRTTLSSEASSHSERNKAKGYKYEEPIVNFDPYNNRKSSRGNDGKSDEKTHSESQKGYRYDEPEVKFSLFDSDDKDDEDFRLSHFKISDSSENRKLQRSRTTLLSEASSHSEQNKAKGYKYEEPIVNFDPYNNKKSSRENVDKSDDKLHSESQKGYRYDEPEVKFNPFDSDDKDDEVEDLRLSHFKISDSSEKRKPQSSRAILSSEASSHSERNKARGYKYEEPIVNFDPYNNRKSSRGNDDKSDEKIHSESQKGYRYDEPEVKFNPFDSDHKDDEDEVIGLSHFKISESSEKRKPQSSRTTLSSEAFSHSERNNAKGYKYEEPTVNFNPYNNKEPSRDNNPKSDEKIHSQSQKGYRYEEPKVKFNPLDNNDDEDEDHKGLAHFKISSSGEKQRSQSSHSTFKSEPISPKVNYESNNNANENESIESKISLNHFRNRGPTRSGVFKSDEKINSETRKGYRYDEPKVKFNPFDNDDSKDEDKIIGGLSHFKISNSDEKRKPQSSRTTFVSKDFSSTEQNDGRRYKSEEPRVSYNSYNNRNEDSTSNEKVNSGSQKGYRYDEPKGKINFFEGDNRDDEEVGIIGFPQFKTSNSDENQRPQNSRTTFILDTVSNPGTNNRGSYKYEEPKISFNPYNGREQSRDDEPKSDEKFHSESQKGYRYDEPKVKFSSFDDDKDEEDLGAFGVSHFKISDSVEIKRPQSSRTTFISKDFNPTKQINTNGHNNEKNTLSLNSHSRRGSSRNSDTTSDKRAHSERQENYSFNVPNVKLNPSDDGDEHDENRSDFGLSHFKISNFDEKRRPQSQPSRFTSESIEHKDQDKVKQYRNEKTSVNFDSDNINESSRNGHPKSDEKFDSKSQKGNGYEEPKVKLNTFDGKDDEDRSSFGFSHFKISDSDEIRRQHSSSTSSLSDQESQDLLGKIKGSGDFGITSFGSPVSHKSQEESEKSHKNHHFAPNLEHLKSADYLDHSFSRQEDDSHTSEKSDSFNFDSNENISNNRFSGNAQSISSSISLDSKEKFKTTSNIASSKQTEGNSKEFKFSNHRSNHFNNNHNSHSVPSHFSSHSDFSSNLGLDTSFERTRGNLAPGIASINSKEFGERNRKSSFGNSNIALESNEDSYGKVPSANAASNSGTKPVIHSNKIKNDSIVNHASQIYGDSIDQLPFNSQDLHSSIGNAGKSLTNGNPFRQLIHREPSLISKYGNSETVKFQRFGPGGFRNFGDDLGPEICERAGLFRHPKSCNQFYECYWDRWLGKFTLHIFNCPVTIVYDSSITGCNWPFNGPPCTEEKDS